jgi:hypothetical protein
LSKLENYRREENPDEGLLCRTRRAQGSICIAVLNAAGKLVMESVVETGAAITLAVWKAGEAFDTGKVSGLAA